MVACKRFGYGTGKAKFKDPPKRFRGKVTRMNDPLEPTFVQDDYPDCRVKRTHRGDLEIDCFVPERGYSERWHWNGNHTIDYEDGSQAAGVTGTKVEKHKSGRIHSTQGPVDHWSGNHKREGIGNSRKNHSHLPEGGSHHRETAVDTTSWNGGKVSHFQASHSGRVHYGLGKGGVNFEEGYHVGVNQATNKQVWTRWEPDGTFHIQVKPKGEEGGNAVVKINPDGSILITSESTITVQSKGTHTIKAPLLKIDAPVKCTKTIEADNSMTSPHFHGCADRAKGPC